MSLSAAALGVLAALFVFHPFTPNFPFAGIDPSWVAVMGEAADRPARWGVDTAFTYGPASPLVTVYYNAAYFTRTLPLLLGFSALFGWCAALLIAAGHGAGRAAAGTAAVGLTVAACAGKPDAVYFALPFLVFLLAVRREGSEGGRGGLAVPLATALGAAAMGLTAMVKMSFPLAALPLLLLADLAGAARRRWPRLVPCFALGILAGATLYGQRLADLPAYAAMQGEVVAGYAAAMGLAGPGWDLVSFLAAAAVLLAATFLAGLRRPPRDATAWLVPLGLGIEVFFLFKAGFVRHDTHSLAAWSGLCLVGTVVAWARLPRRAGLAVTAAACIVALLYAPVFTVRQSVRVGRDAALAALYRGWLLEGPAREASAAFAALRDPADFRAGLDDEKAESWSDIAGAEPLPHLDGTVDAIPSVQSRLMAAGLDYRGRPSFHEYSTYTPALAAANRAFLEGSSAPRWMLFGPESPLGYMTVDSRFPSFAEGPLWPDLLRLYRPDRRIGSLLALERRAAPAPLPMGPAIAARAGFGAFTPVPGGDAPSSVARPVWATVDVRLNLAGRVLSALFRPPLLSLGVRLDDGTERWFRMVPGLAEAGFLLSPLVTDASDYEALAAGSAAGAKRRVTAVAVSTSGFARSLYDPDVAVTMRTLDISGLAAGASLPPPPADAWEALEGAAGTAADGRVPVPASGVLSLPLWRMPMADGRRRVTLGYGTASPAAGEVCFAVRPADGTGDTLWRRCVEPSGPGDAAGEVALDVPDGTDELALEATCAGGCGASGAAWAEPARSKPGSE